MAHAVLTPVLDAAQARGGDRQAGLLLNLTDDSICKGFSLFNMSARKRDAGPGFAFAVLHQDLAAAAEHAQIHEFGGFRPFHRRFLPFCLEWFAVWVYCAPCGTFALALSLSARTAKTSTARALWQKNENAPFSHA